MDMLSETEVRDLVIAHREAKTMAVYCQVVHCGSGLGWSVRGHNQAKATTWLIAGPYEFRIEAIRAALATGLAIRETH